MPKKSIRSIKLTGRITESKSPIEDIKFVEKKLKQGIAQAAIIRQAINVLRKHEEGKLYDKEIIKDNNSNSEGSDQEEKEQIEAKNQNKNESNVDKEQAEKLKNSLDRKLKSNSFL